MKSCFDERLFFFQSIAFALLLHQSANYAIDVAKIYMCNNSDRLYPGLRLCDYYSKSSIRR